MNDLLPLGALVRRELIRSLRRPVSLRWVAYVVAAAGVVSLLLYPSGDAVPSQLRAASQGVFGAGIMVLFLSAVFLVPPVAASSVVLEREQDTYELLWLTMLGPWGIAVAKTVNAVGYFMLMAVAALPVVSMSAFLIGVDVPLLIVAYVTVLATALSSASIGVMCSANAKSTAGAVVASYVVIFCVLVGYMLPVSIASVVLRQLVPGNPPWHPAFLTTWLLNASPVTSLIGILREPAAARENIGVTLLAFFAQLLVACAVTAKAAHILARPREKQLYLNPPGVGQLTPPARLVNVAGSRPPPLPAAPRIVDIEYLYETPLPLWPPVPDGANPMLARETIQTKLNLRLSDKGTALLFITALVLFGFTLMVTGAMATAEVYGHVYVWTILALLAPVVIAPVAASPCWAREREQETFDGLRMTVLTPWQIVSGKAGAAMRASAKMFAMLFMFTCPALVGILTAPAGILLYIGGAIGAAVAAFECVAVCVYFGLRGMRTPSAIVSGIVLLALLHAVPFVMSFAFIGGEPASAWLDLLPAVLSPAIACVVLLSHGSTYPILGALAWLASCVLHAGVGYFVLRRTARRYEIHYSQAG